MKRILYGQISPTTFMAADEGIANTTVTIPDTALTDRETVVGDGNKEIEIAPRIEGEVEPDLNELFGSEDADSGGDPQTQEKPATEAPEKKEETPKPERNQPLPEDEEAATAPEKKEEPKTEEKKVEAAKIPADDKDLDEIQPKPGSSPKIKNDFDRLKEQTKAARAEARRIETEKTELATIKADLEKKLAEAKPITPELEAEIKELKTLRARTLKENDPEIKAQYDGKITSLDERLITTLKDFGLSEDDEKALREKGIEGIGREFWSNKLGLMEKNGFPIERGKVLAMLTERETIKDQKAQKIAEITKDAETYEAQQAEATKKKWEDFGKAVNAKATVLGKDHPWAAPVEIKPDMTPEAKAKAEKHNAEVADRTKKFVESIQKTVSLDSDTITELAFAAQHREILIADNKQLKTEIDKHSARVAELEAEIAAISRTGRVTTKSSAPDKKVVVTPGIGTSADEAFDAYFEGKP